MGRFSLALCRHLPPWPRCVSLHLPRILGCDLGVRVRWGACRRSIAGVLRTHRRLCSRGSSCVWGAFPSDYHGPSCLLGKCLVLSSHRARGWQPGEGPPPPLPLEGPPRQPSSAGGPGPLGSGQLSLRMQDLTDFIDFLLLIRPSLAASLNNEINRHLQAGAPLTDAASVEVRLGAQGRDSGLQSASRELVAPAREP